MMALWIALIAETGIPSGVIIAIISGAVAFLTAYLSLRGKKVDAVEWLTERLREDAEEARARVKEEADSYRSKIELLEQAVGKLQQTETDLMAYISMLEDEIKALRSRLDDV